MTANLRYIAPAVVASTIVATGLASATAASASPKRDACASRTQLCLYYSSGFNSATYQRNYSYVWPSFSFNCFLENHNRANQCFRADFANGNGAGTGVQNNAHSVANNGASSTQLWSTPRFGGPEFVIGAFHASPEPIGNHLMNNEASYKSGGCSSPPHHVC